MIDGQRPNSTPVHVNAEDGTWMSIGEILNQVLTGGPAPASGSIYSNFLPFVTPEAVKLYNDFERTLYASL